MLFRAPLGIPGHVQVSLKWQLNNQPCPQRHLQGAGARSLWPKFKMAAVNGPIVEAGQKRAIYCRIFISDRGYICILYKIKLVIN